MHWQIKHFQPHELLSPVGLREFKKGNFLLNPSAVAFLVNLREIIDQPILINHSGMTRRGYRSCSENIAVNGGDASRHCQGLAFDCTPKNMNLIRFASIAIHQGWCGVGIYLDKNFVHIDRRPNYTQKVTLWVEKERGKPTISRTLDSKTISDYDILQVENLVKTLIDEI